MIPGGSRESLPKRKVRFADKQEAIRQGMNSRQSSPNDLPGRERDPLDDGRFMLCSSHSEVQLMKAIVTTQYGPPEVLQLREITTPAPAAGQVLIKLYTSSVNPLDSFMMRGPLFFLPDRG
jgi:hypothetical protein